VVILITGAKGLLGNYLCKELEKTHTLVKWNLPEFDITEKDRTIKEIKKVRPGMIIHLAAFTDVDGCELDKERAYKTNVIGTWAVVIGALISEASFLYLSTDYIFDGRKGEPYLEYDEPNPLNFYGKTKLYGERIVNQHIDRFFIIRSSGLYGRGGRNFVDTIIERSEKERILRVVKDQIVSTTYAKDLALFINRLINTEYYGIHNFTNSGSCSWYEFAQEIKRIKGLNVEIEPIASSELNRPAKRPIYSVLRTSPLFEKPRGWREALEEYLIKRL